MDYENFEEPEEDEFAMMVSQGINDDNITMIEQGLLDGNIDDEEALSDYIIMAAGLGRVRALEYLIDYMLDNGYDVDFTGIAEQGIIIGNLPIVQTAFRKYVDYYDETPDDEWNSVYNMARRSGWRNIIRWLEGPNVLNVQRRPNVPRR